MPVPFSSPSNNQHGSTAMKRYHWRDFSPLLVALILLRLFSPSAASAQESLPRPKLAFTCSHWDDMDYSVAPARMRGFTGLTVEELRERELYPIIPALFFDGGSAEIPDRYIMLADPVRVAEFADTAIPGGTFEKYYQLLNIIGYRMRRHPDARITVTGCNTAEPAAGETRELSARRAGSIEKYLTDIWGIAPSRIAIASRDLPEIPSDRHDPRGIAENRRTEVTSADWEILRPVVYADFRRFPIGADTMHFQMWNGVPDSLVASREIEIIWEGKPWHVMKSIGIRDSVSPAWAWARNDTPDPAPDDLPSRSTPFTARLAVHLRDGSVLHSDDLSIPIRVVEGGSPQRYYTAITFGFRQAGLTPLNRRVLREYIIPDIENGGGEVEVMGCSGTMEAGTDGGRIAGERATAVATDIRATIKKSPSRTIQAHGIEGEDRIYPNELPEGRFYNRTVQVRIVHPTRQHPGTP
jgi:hypothetical protein